MQQVWIPRAGDPSVLEIREAPDPKPGPGEVRIRVDAAGVNFADAMARMGLYRDAPPLPLVVGYEVAGTVDAVGSGVSELREGDPVIAGTQFGGYSSMVVVGEHYALKRPAGLDAKQGASLIVTGLTAWMALEEMGRVREGDRVLVHSAGGGVGLAALDLLKWRKAYAIGTASASKHEFLKARGYDQLIDYRTQDWEEALAQGPGLDLVLDPIGGDSWAKGFRALRAGGRLVCYGFSAGAAGSKKSFWNTLSAAWSIPWTIFNPITVLNNNKGVLGINMGRMWSDVARLRPWIQRLIDLWQQGILRPHVHAAVPFSRAAEAHRLLHARENIGKILLVPRE